jgi:hypothetical protein
VCRPVKKVDEIMNELERGREAEEEIREALMIQPPDDVRLIFISFPLLVSYSYYIVGIVG